MARLQRKTTTGAGSCLVQGLALMLPFIGLGLGGFLGLAFGILLALPLIVIGARLAVEFRCGNCGNKVPDKLVKKCASCGSWFGDTDD